MRGIVITFVILALSAFASSGCKFSKEAAGMKAMGFYQQGQKIEAKGYPERAVKYYRISCEAYNKLTDSEKKTENAKKAEEACKKYEELKSKYPEK